VRAAVDLMSIADRIWPITRNVMKGHTVVYRATNGLIGHRVPGAPPMLLLDHVGARSGTHRTSALAYVRDGENLVVVASKGGHPRHPSWFHNLRAHPDTTVQVGAEHRRVRARVATPGERERLWPRAVEAWGPFESYQRRTSREIPLVVLVPR
jgi:deazaflavin-dependent oxidoreductase (nitroreductase family)